MAGVKREEKNSQMKRNAASPQQHTTLLIISPGILFLVNVLMVIISDSKPSEESLLDKKTSRAFSPVEVLLMLQQ